MRYQAATCEFALTTPFIASSRQERSQWREQRRVTYDDFPATCAVRRRRLEAQARQVAKGDALGDDDQDERDEAREAVVAAWDRVRLATDSSSLRSAAEGMMIVVDDLRRRLDDEGRVSSEELADLQAVWDDHRDDYFTQARADLRLPA
jgi:hypothetical protein